MEGEGTMTQGEKHVTSVLGRRIEGKGEEVARGNTVDDMWCDFVDRWYEAVLAAEDDICTIMTLECGKPLAESRGEFASGCV
jgi:hypothetical protein